MIRTITISVLLAASLSLGACVDEPDQPDSLANVNEEDEDSDEPGKGECASIDDGEILDCETPE